MVIERLRVALTFDAEHPSRSDCPPGAVDRILDALRTAEARATFFVQGRWASAYPTVARRIAEDGHLVGNHSNFHAPMELLSSEGLVEDVRAAEARITAAAGVDPRPWFRCPFGRGQDAAGVAVAIRDLGYRTVGWDVGADDWEDGRDAASVENDVVSGVAEHGDGAVVLLHTWPGPTADALPAIIRRLQEDGFGFVRVDEVWDAG
jgi:peptidoglycan/xylan/chitin deacetylase (PgdA/CDA1 family)